ncbi:MAG: protein kinase [Clostridia bacterium]|nr:protein kinase [Clostridia bacterium]
MLNVNGTKLCQLCFSPIVQGSKICTHCSNIGNRTKYPVVLKEGVILAGRYSVGKVLGKGGFGVTYLCYDLVMNKKVAIKEFFPDSIACRTTESGTVSAMDNTKTQDFKNYAVKFYEEAKLVSKFNGNPNVISVYEFFYENDTAYFVMEALEGMDLKQYVQSKGGKIDIGEALFVTNKMLDALMVVHSAGVLHRDISPDNIYICKNGDVKLIDFGAARQVIGEESKSLSVILKQGFAPIEQYQKKGVQGPWTDIYALGATLYYILTGRQIDDAMSRMEDPKLDMRGIPSSLTGILKKMLELKHNDRFQSVFEVKTAINAIGQELIPVRLCSFCQMCGKEIAFGEKLCSQCSGQESAISDVPDTEYAPVVPKPSQKGFKNKWVIVASWSALALLFVVVSLVLVLNSSGYKYKKAMDLLEDNDFDEAAAAFEEIIDYKDSSEMITETQYQKANYFMEQGQISDAFEIYKEIRGYKESAQMLANMGKFLSAGRFHTAAIRTEGTVVAVGKNDYKQCTLSGWNDIVDISTGNWTHTVGVRSNGSVVAIGSNTFKQCNVTDWMDIVDVAAGVFHTVGLKDDGSVVAVGREDDGECDVLAWNDIVAVSAGDAFSVGLRADGTVAATGKNDKGQIDVSGWQDIIAISASWDNIAGLKSDGTVVSTSDDYDVSEWSDIIAVSVGSSHIVGLKTDGTVVSKGSNWTEQCNVSGWRDIIAISAGDNHTVGLRADGTVVATGDNDDGQCEVDGWKLF